MKLSRSFVASSLFCSTLAARPVVSPDTARLILAQRLGLSRFHSIEHSEAETIRHINTYGGKRQSLFGGQDEDKSQAHLLMWIEDSAQDEATVIINDGSDRTLDFEISSPPSLADNERLIQDLVHQADSLPKHPDPQQRTYLSGIEIESVLPTNNKVERHNDYLTVLRLGKDNGVTGEDLAAILSQVNEKAEKFGFSTTTVVMPASRSTKKRSNNAWGTYVLPASDARRQKSEAVLSSNALPSTSPNTIPDDLESFPVISQAKNKDPVLGILPSCFDSMASCQKTTHNCSSHGECKLLHKGRGKGTDQETTDCYGCACVPTVKYTDGKGMETKKHVTYWGGPACQKQDISVQFWLFALSGVVLAFLVASAIGMMFSMGSEELPSVIGAGVSGPVRK